MYRVTDCPLPRDVRAELERIAAIGTTRLRLAGTWAGKTFAVVGGFWAVIFLVKEVIGYVMYSTFGALTLWSPQSDIWGDVCFMGLATVVAGLGAAAVSHIQWRQLVAQARLARLDLAADRGEYCELTISDRHLIVDDEDMAFLFVPYDEARTAFFLLSPDNDARFMPLTDVANWRSDWSWIRTRNLEGAWAFKSVGAPAAVNMAVQYDDTGLARLWKVLPKDGEILDMTFEAVLAHCHLMEVKRPASVPSARTDAAAMGSLAPAKH